MFLAYKIVVTILLTHQIVDRFNLKSRFDSLKPDES